jgi:hypothetical protein
MELNQKIKDKNAVQLLHNYRGENKMIEAYDSDRNLIALFKVVAMGIYKEVPTQDYKPYFNLSYKSE